MQIQLINDLFSNGTLTALYRSGLINDKVFLYREIYLWVMAQEQTRRISRNQAVTEAQGKFNKDKRTIWRALQCFSGTDTLVSPHI